MRSTRRLAPAYLASLFALVAFACSDDTTTQGTGASSQGGEAGQPSNGGGGESSTGGSPGTGGIASQGGNGAGGDGGSGGAPPPEPGPPGNALVSAGDYVSSPNYKLVFTMGQSTQNQSKMTSPNYRLQGGLIGSTGNLP
ncbi:MAG: hypothetical protein HOW73_20665 [Polyangiaceae bacterium]|nr:hypothetical protein [Polyangiaceae bacterium]